MTSVRRRNNSFDCVNKQHIRNTMFDAGTKAAFSQRQACVCVSSSSRKSDDSIFMDFREEKKSAQVASADVCCADDEQSVSFRCKNINIYYYSISCGARRAQSTTRTHSGSHSSKPKQIICVPSINWNAPAYVQPDGVRAETFYEHFYCIWRSSMCEHRINTYIFTASYLWFCVHLRSQTVSLFPSTFSLFRFRFLQKEIWILLMLRGGENGKTEDCFVFNWISNNEGLWPDIAVSSSNSKNNNDNNVVGGSGQINNLRTNRRGRKVITKY